MYNKIVKVNAVKLTLDQVNKSISGYWKFTDNSISNTYIFKNFEDTWSFLTKIAMRSHLTGHHPTIINTYNKVTIKLTTHDVNGVSDIDIKLANRFDNYYNLFK